MVTRPAGARRPAGLLTKKPALRAGGWALSKARRLGLKMSGPASVPKRSDRPPGVCASIFLISTLACTIEHLSTSVVIYRPAS